MSRIEDYALIGDLHTGALVGKDGSIDWLCLPNFDSPACFAALLDTERAGRWLLAPAGGGQCTRRSYHGDTLVLETEWQTRTGRVKVIDFMPPRTAATDVVRIVEGITGSVRMHTELILRFDYGRIVPAGHLDVAAEDVGHRAGARGSGNAPAAWKRSPAPTQSGCAPLSSCAGRRKPQSRSSPSTPATESPSC